MSLFTYIVCQIILLEWGVILNLHTFKDKSMCNCFCTLYNLLEHCASIIFYTQKVIYWEIYKFHF